MEPTRAEDRSSRRNVFVVGLIAIVVLVAIVIAGPQIAGKFRKEDPSGSHGNPTRVDPKEPGAKQEK